MRTALNKQIIKPFCNIIIKIITLYRDDFKLKVKNNEKYLMHMMNYKE